MPELDGLRGIAVLMVLLLHSKPGWFFWGWAGVDLFLVLSGFLITRILLENRHQPGMLRAFYARRALRILPVYYLALLLTAAMFSAPGLLNPHAAVDIPAGHWRSLVFAQNIEQYWGGPEAGYIWYFRHSWSVAVEEQFYLAWPALLVLFASRLRLLLPLGVAALIASYAARASQMSPHVLLTRIDGLVYGAAIAFATTFRPTLLQRVRLPVVAAVALSGLTLVAPYLWLGSGNSTGTPHARAAAVPGFAILFAAAVWCALKLSGQRSMRWLGFPALRWIGRISFGLYMYHVPIGFLGMLGVSRGFWGAGAATGIMWLGGLAAAQLSYSLFEGPILKLKRNVPYAAPAPSPESEKPVQGIGSTTS